MGNMSKAQGRRAARQRRKPAELSEAIEGQIAEICRDVAAGVKRMRQLQQQTDELRMIIREWARESNPTGRTPVKGVDW